MEEKLLENILPALIALFSVVIGTFLGWYLNNISKMKELKTKILSENRIKWIEIFRQEISEFMYYIDKLGKYAILKSAIEKNKTPDSIKPEEIKINYDEALEKVVSITIKIKLLLLLDDATHQNLINSILDLRNVVTTLDCDLDNQQVLNEKFNNILHNCHKILQFEDYLLKSEVK